MYLSRKFILLVCSSALLLNGCVLQKNTQTQEPESEIVELGPETQVEVLSLSEVQQIISLLDKADLAVKEKRLTTPAGDNANSYYRQVLAIEPEHQEAHQGLNRIVQSYLNWGRAALSRDQFEQAKVYTARAAKVDPKNPGVVKLNKQINAAQARQQRQAITQKGDVGQEVDAVEAESVVGSGNYLKIDADELKDRSLDARVQLFNFADDVRNKDARVLILAPTDKDGRWMYQQLNNRHADYRVRASLRIDPQAGVRILE